MNIEYTVHSVTQGPARVPAIVEGTETTAIIDCVEVELTPTLIRHGSLTLRFIAAERAEAADLFTPDKKVTISVA